MRVKTNSGLCEDVLNMIKLTEVTEENRLDVAYKR